MMQVHKDNCRTTSTFSDWICGAYHNLKRLNVYSFGLFAFINSSLCILLSWIDRCTDDDYERKYIKLLSSIEKPR